MSFIKQVWYLKPMFQALALQFNLIKGDSTLSFFYGG